MAACGRRLMAPIAQRLREAAERLPPDRVSLRALAHAHGPGAQGSWLLLLSAPCLLPVPGVGTLLGLGLVTLALAMWRGVTLDELPPRVAALEMSHPWARRVLALLATTYALAGRRARERLLPLVQVPRRSALALLVGSMALVIVLPIPFGNVLPALALGFVGLGLAFRDGLAVLLGWATGALALLATTAMGLVAWHWGAAGVAQLF